MASREKIIKSNYEYYIDFVKKFFRVDLENDIESYASTKVRKNFDDVFFQDFVENKLYNKDTLDRMKLTVSNEVFVSSMKAVRNYVSQIYSFSKNNHNIYRFQEGLTQKLIDTEIKKIDGYFLRIPENSVYYDFPHNNTVKIYDPSKGFVTVSGVYLSMEKITSTVLFDRTYTAADNVRLLKIFAIAGNPLNIEKQTFFYGNIIVKDDEDIFTSLKEQVKKFIIPGFEKTAEHIDDLFRLICNASLYINSANPDINPVKALYNHKAKTPREIAENVPYSKYDIKSVGDNITINRNYSDGTKESVRTNVIGALHWTVRPHWRLQAFGKNWSERKVIWIEKYEKGKDLSAEINKKNYNVK